MAFDAARKRGKARRILDPIERPGHRVAYRSGALSSETRSEATRPGSPYRRRADGTSCPL
jgi:hypothetical protein